MLGNKSLLGPIDYRAITMHRVFSCPGEMATANRGLTQWPELHQELSESFPCPSSPELPTAALSAQGGCEPQGNSSPPSAPHFWWEAPGPRNHGPSAHSHSPVPGEPAQHETKWPGPGSEVPPRQPSGLSYFQANAPGTEHGGQWFTGEM